jgi:amino acid transporter
LGTAIFGGVYFTVVTAIEMMGFGTDANGVKSFAGSSALMGDLGSSYVGSWVGDVVTLGAAISAFGCCLACVVGASRLLFAIARDVAPESALAKTGSNDTPAAATTVVTALVALIALFCAVFANAKPFDTFLWSGTLILLVAYALASLGCIKLVFVDRKMDVPQWQVVIPVAAIAMLVYTAWRNVHPYPPSGAAHWLPIVAFGWVVLVTVLMLASPGVARRLTAGLAQLDDEGELSAAP